MSGPTRDPSFYETDNSFFGNVKQGLLDTEQAMFDWQDQNLRQKGTTADKYLEEQQATDSYRVASNPLEWSASPGYPKFGEMEPPSLMRDVPVASEENIEKGGVLNPDPLQNPAGAISAMSVNRGSGQGNDVGFQRPPEAPSPKEQSQRIQQEQSKQILFDQTKIPAWHESTSFYNGLLSMGMNLLAGNDIATAFNQGAQVFDRNFGIEKRQAWAEDLRAYGYDDLEIMKYIETGDNKVLTDPMERQRQARQDALAEAQLRKAEFESDPARLAYKDEVDYYKLEEDAKERAFNKQMKLEDLELRRRNMSMLEADRLERREIAKAKAAAAGGKYNEQLSKATNQYLRGRQGLKNYQETEQRLAPKYDERGAMGKMLDSKIIDMVFEGKETSTQLARMMNNDATEMITAEREFLAPLLRKDSGAAISAGEWRTTGEVYFPRPGDSPERRAQKQQAREVAVLAMNPQASPQLQEVMRQYTTGGITNVRVKGSKVYANDGRGWFEVLQ